MSRFGRFIRGEPKGDQPYVQLMVAYSDDQITDKHRLVTSVRGFPLTWWTVWINILFTTTLGVVTALCDPGRFSSHIFDGAKTALDWLPGDPMHAWGWIFALAGAVLAVATYVSPLFVVWVLRLSATVFLLHAVLIGIGAHDHPAASWSGCMFCTYVCCIHLACAQSILMILRYRFPKATP